MNSFDLGELVLTVLLVSRRGNKFLLVICAARVECVIYKCPEVTLWDF